jgi:hypothetical protein
MVQAFLGVLLVSLFLESYSRDRQEWDHVALGIMGSDLRMVKEILS